MVALAKPVNNGVASLDGDFTGFNVTVGEVVSTVNVTGSLTPEGLPSELSWAAVAVYCPLERAGLAWPDVQSPPVPVAVALETTEPSAVDPAWMC